MKRQQARRLILFISLMLFPIIMNYMSPYLIVNGAFEGILAGSGIIFLSLFLFSLFMGRLFCGWICPMGGLNDILVGVNGRRITSKAAKRIKYIIWGIWFIAILGGFLAAGGLRDVNLLYMNEGIISVDEPFKYITYYFVILLFAIISILAGRRASCHTICWIAPFMIFGKKLSDLLRLPRLKVNKVNDNCTKCKRCNEACPMSIDVAGETEGALGRNDNCILCGMCVDTCPKHCLSYRITNN